MKVTDEVLQKKIEYAKWFMEDMKTSLHGVPKEAEETLVLFLEVQSLRKIDIPGTLKYAEEAGAAIEEMKHGIEEANKEIEGCIKKYNKETNYWYGQRAGYLMSLAIIHKHLSKYLDE